MCVNVSNVVFIFLHEFFHFDSSHGSAEFLRNLMEYSWGLLRWKQVSSSPFAEEFHRTLITRENPVDGNNGKWNWMGYVFIFLLHTKIPLNYCLRFIIHRSSRKYFFPLVLRAFKSELTMFKIQHFFIFSFVLIVMGLLLAIAWSIYLRGEL